MSIEAVLAARADILGRSSAIASAAPAGAAKSASGTPGFGALLANAMDGVAHSQQTAGDMAAAFERGDTNDIAAVQLARQAAGVEFQATLQVRNRVLTAYRDIMSMGV